MKRDTKWTRWDTALSVSAALIWFALWAPFMYEPLYAQTYGTLKAKEARIIDATEPVLRLDTADDTDGITELRYVVADNTAEFYTGGTNVDVKFISAGTDWMDLDNPGLTNVKPNWINGMVTNNTAAVAAFAVENESAADVITFQIVGSGEVTQGAPGASVTYGPTAVAGEWGMTGDIAALLQNEVRWYDAGLGWYTSFKANSASMIADVPYTLPAADGSSADVFTTSGSGVLSWSPPRSVVAMSAYIQDAERTLVSGMHGGIQSLSLADTLDTVPTDIVVTKGTGKIVMMVNAASDFDGEITITGTVVDRETGASGASTDTITVDALTTGAGATTDANSNTIYAWTGAYISAKWFVGSVTLSTVDLTITDIDVYHVSFEQMNDVNLFILDTLDVNVWTDSAAAELDVYLYSLETTGDKCDIERTASVHVGDIGEAAIQDKYFRLRKGAIAKGLDGTADGFWLDVWTPSTPVDIEDLTVKVWATVQP